MINPKSFNIYAFYIYDTLIILYESFSLIDSILTFYPRISKDIDLNCRLIYLERVCTIFMFDISTILAWNRDGK